MNCKATYLCDFETPFVMSITFFTVRCLVTGFKECAVGMVYFSDLPTSSYILK